MDQHEQVLTRIESGNSKTHDLLGDLIQAISGLTTAFKYSVEREVKGNGREKESSWGTITACGGLLFGVMVPMYFAVDNVITTQAIMAGQMRQDDDREANDKGVISDLQVHSLYSNKRLQKLEDIVYARAFTDLKNE
jgi:hypothetical protein